MTLLARWRDYRDVILRALTTLLEGQVQIMATLDDLKAGQTAERALVERLLALIAGAPAGTFTAAQQAEIDAIAADQAATLAEGGPTPTPAA